MNSTNEHDRVVLAAGDVGIVVHVYREEKASEVEFVSLDGETIAVITLSALKFVR